MEAALGSEEFCTSLYGYDSFFNYNEEGTAKVDHNEE